MNVDLCPLRCRFVSELSVSPLGIVCSFARPSSVILSFHLQAAQFFVYSYGPRGIVMSFHLKSAHTRRCQLVVMMGRRLEGWQVKGWNGYGKSDWLTDWRMKWIDSFCRRSGKNNDEFTLQVAVKLIKKSAIENKADLVRIRREIRIMSCLNHPNIIQIFEGKFFLF